MRDLEDVRQYYDARLREHGTSARGVDWKDEASQRTRFRELARVLEGADPDRAFSINDIGCGYGAFAGFLRERFPSFDYTGFDISSDMIAAAARASSAEGVTFTTDRDAVPVADFTVASGIFNVRLNTADDEWLKHILSTLDFIHGRSRIAWSVNFLTSYSDAEKMAARLYYTDPLFIFDWCKRTKSRWVALLHDYGLYEFTIVVRKES